jgi:hypothetical protein
VQWFLDRKQFLDLACGPLLRLSREEFRRIGHDLVRKHFKDYQGRDVSQARLTPLYPAAEEKRFDRLLKDQHPIRIGEDPPGFLRLISMEFRNITCSLICEKAASEWGKSSIPPADTPDTGLAFLPDSVKLGPCEAA